MQEWNLYVLSLRFIAFISVTSIVYIRETAEGRGSKGVLHAMVFERPVIVQVT